MYIQGVATYNLMKFYLTTNYTIDMERFPRLNFRGFNPIEVLMEILSYYLESLIFTEKLSWYS